MFNERAPKLAPPLIQAIEDAVLFGNIRELDGVLDLVREDAAFPRPLREALEALMHFRINYGRGGALEPRGDAEKSRAVALESAWGKEIIEMIGHYPDMTEVNYA